jgi:tetratricopeptide (TPR) repeat protein
MEKTIPRLAIVCLLSTILLLSLVASPANAQKLPYKFEDTVDGKILEDVDKALYTLSMRLMFFPERYPSVRGFGKTLAARKGRDIDSVTIYDNGFWKAFFVMSPTDPSLFFARAFLLFQDGQLQKTEYLLLLSSYHSDPEKPENQIIIKSLLDRITTIKDKSSQLVLKGVKATSQKEYKRARSYYQQALQLYPKSPYALYEVGLSYLNEQGKQDINAIQQTPEYRYFRDVVLYDPFSWRAYQGQPREIESILQIRDIIAPSLEQLRKYEYDNQEFVKFADACMHLGQYEYAVYAYWNHAILNQDKLMDPETITKLIWCLKILKMDEAAEFIANEIATFNRLMRVKDIEVPEELEGKDNSDTTD